METKHNDPALSWTPLFSIVSPYTSLTGRFQSGEKLFVGLREVSPGWHRVHVTNAAGKVVNRILTGPWRKRTAVKHARNNFGHCAAT